MTHRRWVMYQILQGLAHMHSADVFHRDLKPGNILINANCDCKICDFGMARAKKPDGEEETVALWTDYVASRWYRAPELICCYLTRYTAAIDVWSVGCIASELLLRKALFPGKNGEQQLDLITDLVGAPSREDMQSLRSSRVKELLRSMRGKTAADFRAYYPPEADDLELALIKEMLLFSADKRTPAGQAIQHKYFDAIRDLPGAQIPYVETPVLDKSEFVFEEAKR
jgi:mitogen-activated protein kinase 1/3